MALLLSVQAASEYLLGDKPVSLPMTGIRDVLVPIVVREPHWQLSILRLKFSQLPTHGTSLLSSNTFALIFQEATSTVVLVEQEVHQFKPSQSPEWPHIGSCSKNKCSTLARSSQLLQQPALTQLMEVGNGDTSHIGDRILAFNFTWKLIPTNWLCSLVASATHSLKSSNGGKKGCKSWSNAKLFCNHGFCTRISGSGCITSTACWLTTSEVRGPLQLQFSVLPVTQPCAYCEIHTVTTAKMDTEHQNLSDSASVLNYLLRCHIYFMDFTSSASVLTGRKKAESGRDAKLRQQ